MGTRKTWWAYSLDDDAIEFLRQPDYLQRSILCNLKSYSEHGALFSADPEIQDKIDRIVHLKGVFDWIRRRGFEFDPSDANTLSCNGPQGRSLNQIDETEISQIDHLRKIPDLDQMKWSQFESFLIRFFKIESNANLQLMLVDRYALKGNSTQIEKKLSIVARLIQMISKFESNRTNVTREVKLIHCRDRNNISDDECRHFVKSLVGSLPNDVRFHCLRFNSNEIHSRYIIWPWWYLLLDKGLDTFWIDDQDRIRLDQPDAWLELKPWPTEPKDRIINHQIPDREVLRIAQRFGSKAGKNPFTIK